MHAFFRFSAFFLTLSLVVVNVATSQPVFAQRKAGGLNLRGLILDESGAGLAGAEITLTTSAGKNLQSVSGEKGGFAFDGLAPGEYLVKVSAPGFAPYQSEVIQLGEGQPTPLVIQMAIETVAEQVTVDANQPLSLSADNNASAVVFKGADLETLPEDPDELA
ncbi:MAG TPA: carboxypeptidase-like regulatory domain-containing protein, partial [Acidobacteriota bacterium]|nr:carboxypeptidase-like regulatory domain-containing protein [Acidobacteriota bacterium]